MAPLIVVAVGGGARGQVEVVEEKRDVLETVVDGMQKTGWDPLKNWYWST